MGEDYSGLVVQLAEQGRTPLNPVVDGLVRVEQDGDDVVGGVAGGGECTAPLARLVDRTHVAHLRIVDVLGQRRLQPDDGHVVVQDLGFLLSQHAARGRRTH